MLIDSRCPERESRVLGELLVCSELYQALEPLRFVGRQPGVLREMRVGTGEERPCFVLAVERPQALGQLLADVPVLRAGGFVLLH